MSNDYISPSRSPMHTGVVVLLLLGLALALAGNAYQFVKATRLASQVASVQQSLQSQITRLSDATNGAFDVAQHRFEELKRLQDSTSAALIDARSESRHSSSQVAARLEERNQELEQANRELIAQLTALKQDVNSRLQTTAVRLQNTTTKLDTADAKLQRISTEADANRADLKRVSGDLNSIRSNLSGTAPTQSAAATAPGPSPEHRHLPFDLLTTKVPTRIGEIQIAIRSTDPKNNRYTMDLYTGDKTALGRDCAVNEAVRFYRSGDPLPYEVVVSQIRKDEVIGYVTAPSTPNLRMQSAAAALR